MVGIYLVLESLFVYTWGYVYLCPACLWFKWPFLFQTILKLLLLLRCFHISESLFLPFWFNIVTSKHIFSRLFSDLQVLLTYPNIDKIPGQKWSLLSFSVQMNWFQPLIFENNGQFPQFHICLLKCTDSFCLVKSGLGQHVLITYKSNPRILHRNSSVFICLPISLCIPSGL